MPAYPFVQSLWLLVRTYACGVSHWAPATLRRRVVTLSKLLLSPLSCARVVHTLAAAKLARLVRKDPTIFLKFSRFAYSSGLSIAQTAALVATHYDCLLRKVGQEFLNVIFDGRARLWDANIGAHNFGIYLSTVPVNNIEGELTLHFRTNTTDIYVLSFIIAPAPVLGLNADHAIFVTGLQGIRGTGELVKLATKSAVDVSPPLILMAAIQGIAQALGIGHVVGINAADQVCTAGLPPTQDFISAYDEFWTSIQGRRLSSGHFSFPIPLPEKPLAQIKHNHRLRVRARRAFRNEVAVQVREVMSEACRN